MTVLVLPRDHSRRHAALNFSFLGTYKSGATTTQYRVWWTKGSGTEAHKKSITRDPLLMNMMINRLSSVFPED